MITGPTRTDPTRRQTGFTLVELLVVMLIVGIVAGAILGLYLGVVRAVSDDQSRMQNQDSARTAMYEMTRFIRSACSSDSNLTSISDSVLLANPQELVFYVDLDQDNEAERVRYHLDGTDLHMQVAEPDTSQHPPTYPDEYSLDSVVVQGGVQNGTDPIFTYYGYDDDTTTLYEIPSPNTSELRLAVVAIGVRLIVNEGPQTARSGVDLSTRVLIRQRYDGGLSDD